MENNSSDNRVVHIVHCIDAEGPLYESLAAKFERLRDLYKVEVAPTRENLARLQKGEIDLGGVEKDIQQTLSGHLINFNDTWDKIDAMLDRIMTPSFRREMTDSFGGGWVFNWHCLDHVGYQYNPRRRDMGYHNIFDHYRARILLEKNCPDGLHWHFHPMSTYREAHRCATSFINSPELYQILCRRIIEREWFPSVFRAGFQTERPDSHWFLEQWIPFDISNMAMADNSDLDKTIDFKNGRSADWRLAPHDWSVYHPDHDYYQLKGNCRRWIGRALNVMNRLCNLDQDEMDRAFERADNGKPALVGIAAHDFRDLEKEVQHIRGLIRSSAKKYPGVKFRFCEAIEGFRQTIWPQGVDAAALDLSVSFHPASSEDVAFIEVSEKSGKVFGPQPFLALQTKSRKFIHDNFDMAESMDRWFYAFHADTLPLEDVAAVGVAANDQYGNSCVKTIQFD